MATPKNGPIVVSALAALLSVACVAVGGTGRGAPSSDGTDAPVTPTDTPALDDAGPSEPPAAVDAEASPPTSLPPPDATPAKACANAKDLADNGNEIAFTVSSLVTPAPLTPACVRVRRGKTLLFDGGLTLHPLEVVRLDGTALPPSGKGKDDSSVRLDEEGTFVVRCPLHPDVETGFVVVVP